MVYIPKDPLAMKRMKRSKYGNTKVHAQGRKFDSIIERDRFFFLQEAQRRGEIRNLRCQVRFKLDVNGSHICDYVADFVYEKAVTYNINGLTGDVEKYNGVWDAFGTTVVEDVKGGYKKLPVFALKEKLMKAVHGVEIHIVKSATLQI